MPWALIVLTSYIQQVVIYIYNEDYYSSYSDPFISPLSEVEEPIFASAVPAVQRRQLRDVLKEIVEAYAQNLDSNRENLNPDSLRDLLRKKVAARNK